MLNNFINLLLEKIWVVDQTRIPPHFQDNEG